MEIAKNRIKELLDARADLPEFSEYNYIARFNVAKRWFMAQLDDAGFNIKPKVLDNIINNKRNLNVKELVLIPEIFGLNPFEILENFGGEIFKKEQRKIALKNYTNPSKNK